MDGLWVGFDHALDLSTPLEQTYFFQGRAALHRGLDRLPFLRPRLWRRTCLLWAESLRLPPFLPFVENDTFLPSLLERDHSHEPPVENLPRSKETR